MKKFDLLLKGGKIVDPSQNLNSIQDISFSNGKVAESGTELDQADAKNMIDCSGYIITPGLIDIHVHTFIGGSHYGIEPDLNCINKGVFTAIDAGSAGAKNFKDFKINVMDMSKTQLFAYLNISSYGLSLPGVGELQNKKNIDISETVKTVKKYKDFIVGIKVRLTKKIVNESLGIQPLYIARTIADKTDLPVVIHPQAAWCESIDDILTCMQNGDILTHCFHGRECGILAPDGNIRESVHEAVERGIIFDVGHGRGSFSFNVAEKALNQGFRPTTISTDLHAYCLSGPVYDLPNTISKFLHLGLTIEELISMTSNVPAKVINAKDKIGTLAKGTTGNAVVFDLQEGNFNLIDSHEQTRAVNTLLVPKIIIRNGSVHNPYSE